MHRRSWVRTIILRGASKLAVLLYKEFSALRVYKHAAVWSATSYRKCATYR